MSYADYLTGERSKERLKGVTFIKCVDCENFRQSKYSDKAICKIWDNKIQGKKAPRICRFYSESRK